MTLIKFKKKLSLICLASFYLFQSLLAQPPSKKLIQTNIDSVNKAKLLTYPDVAKVEYEIGKIASITPKIAILIPNLKSKKTIDSEKKAFEKLEHLKSTQNILKALRLKNKIELEKEFETMNEIMNLENLEKDFYHKRLLIHRVILEKDIQNKITESNNQKNDSTIIFYVAQVTLNIFYNSGKIENKKFSLFYNLNSEFKNENSFDGHLFE